MQLSATPALPPGLRGARTARRGILGSSDGGRGGADEADPTTPRERVVVLTESELATQEALVKILCSKVASDIELKFDGDSTIVIPTGATAAHASGGGSGGSGSGSGSGGGGSGGGGSGSGEEAFVGAAGLGALRSVSEELPDTAALPASASGSAAAAAPLTPPSSSGGAPTGHAEEDAPAAASAAASAVTVKTARDDVLSAQRNFTVTALWSAQFAALRKLYLGDAAELAYIESLACCKPWRAKGGKSDAEFMKTLDDRFIMKMVNEKEIKAWQSKGKDFALS